MKKLPFLILFLSISAYSQYFTTISGGLSLAIGDESEYLKPGPFASFESNVLLNKHFGIGGHIEYNWIISDTSKVIADREGYHIFDIGLVPKLHIPVNKDFNFSFEIDPAYLLILAYAEIEDEGTISESASGFMITYGTGITFRKLSLAFKIKTGYFTIDNGYDDSLNNMNLLTFSIGYRFQ